MPPRKAAPAPERPPKKTKKPPVRGAQRKAAKAAAKPATKPARRADFGAPVDTYFAKLSPEKAAMLTQVRTLIHEVAPGVKEAIKWGMPFFEVEAGPSKSRVYLAALSASKNHVSVMFPAPSELLPDPHGRLEGSGKGMRHLKIRAPGELRPSEILGWLHAVLRHQHPPA